MKKTIKYMAVFIAAVLMICCLSACGAGGSGTANGGNGTADDKASESVDSEAETAGNDNVQADTGTGESGAVDAIGSGDDAAVDSAAAENSAAGAAESAQKSGKGVSAAGDTSIAETVLQNTKSGVTKILTMDSMQSTTPEDIANGADYLKIMTQNLAVLKEALTK